MKWVLSELDGMDPEDERFDAKVTVLMENVRHHVEEEESDYFPKVRDELGRNALADIGEVMAQARKIAPTHPTPRAPDTPPGNLVMGTAAGVATRVGDTVSGLAQGGVSAVTDLIARVLGQERPPHLTAGQQHRPFHGEGRPRPSLRRDRRPDRSDRKAKEKSSGHPADGQAGRRAHGKGGEVRGQGDGDIGQALGRADEGDGEASRDRRRAARRAAQPTAPGAPPPDEVAGRAAPRYRHEPNNKLAAGWSSQVARRAHNPKVVGSNPTPATN